MTFFIAMVQIFSIMYLSAYAQLGYAFGCVVYVWPKTGCFRYYRLKISRWCNLLLAHRV